MKFECKWVEYVVAIVMLTVIQHARGWQLVKVEVWWQSDVEI